MSYHREQSIAYAHEWAFRRNPKYYNFDNIGGDCTNFVSQCLYAGCHVMNYTRDLGWYYLSVTNRAPAWTGVDFFYRFLTTNQKSGPYAAELPISRAEPGDVLQLSFDGVTYSHSQLIVSVGAVPGPETILVATHTYDADNRPVSTYPYQSLRLLHIEGVREKTP